MARPDRILIAAGGIVLVLAAAAGWILISPPPSAVEVGTVASGVLIETPSAEPSAGSSTSEASTIVVDVQGAVPEPGIHELPAGARIADALSAAGGYGPDADLEAAAKALNLAAVLADGTQVVVPRVGASTAAVGESGVEPGAGASPAPQGQAGGPINLNTASAEQLEALPGIGPVTVERIIQARNERPFSSLQDAADRGVLDRGQLTDIQGLATAG